MRGGPIVTLLTDFATVDGFVGAMKGVVLSLAPHATLLDLTHDVPPQDIWGGAWALREAAHTFPPGTIHVAVVDPGVGTARRPLLLRASGQLFVGPDNGLLTLAAAEADGGWVLDRPELHRQPVSSTFHGRDVFAAVAGHLAQGVSATACGTPTKQWVRLELPRPGADGETVRGRVVHVDRFGNLITNLEASALGDPDAWRAHLGGRELGALRRTYGDVGPGDWLAYVGSGGAVEIAVREGSAAAAGAARGAEVTLCRR